MQRSELYGKKKKKLPKCANPLFVQWLQEWQQDAAEKGAKSQYTYGKALKTLMRFPLRVDTGKDCKILENFGDKICKMLDDRLQKHIEEHGSIEPIISVEEDPPIKKKVKQTDKKANKGEVTKARRNATGVHELSDSDSEDRAEPQQPARKRQKSGPGGEREYIPVYRSGPYALLLTLYRHMQDPDSVGYLSKAELINKAQALADKSFTLADPGSRYTAWSSMGTLIKKGLVIKDSSPARYSLTDKGCELAARLENAGKVECEDDSIPFRINEPGIAPPPRHEAPPPARLPRMPWDDSDEEVTNEIPPRVPNLSNGLKYWYVTADDREVVFKDQAMVTVEEDIGVGFLIKCNYTAAIKAGVKYKLDMSRPHRDDYCYLYLSNEDAVEIANPPYSHTTETERDNLKKDDMKKTEVGNNVTNDKPKPKKKVPVKISKPQGLQLLPLVNTNQPDNTLTKTENNPTHKEIVLLDSDESSLDSLPSVKETTKHNGLCQNVNRNVKHVTLCQNVKGDMRNVNDVLGDSQDGSQCSIKSLTDNSQSSVSSRLSEPDFVLRPGQFDIVLCVDNAEFYGQSKGSSKTLLPDLMKNGIQCDLRKLHVGDILWVAKERVRPVPGQLESPKGRELVLNYIIERKRMDDLVGSCIDGRFKEQKFRLKKCGLKHLIYLIEDFGSMQHFSIPEATIKQAITNSQVIDEFQVKRTRDTKETVAFLTVLTRYLQSSFQCKTLYACNLESIKEASIDYNMDDIEQRLPTFDEFNQGSVKSKALTVREMFGKQLIQIHGMSAEKALAITERYPTPVSLLRAYRRCVTEKEKENMLSLIRCGKSNRSLGLAQSKQIYQLYNINTALQ